MKNSAHIVQHICIYGGVEELAINFQDHKKNDEEKWIVSLEGCKEDQENHPFLSHRDNIHFLEKNTGLDFKSLLKLSRWFKEKNIRTIYTHHIGPLIYGGLAAKAARIKQHIHIEHDAWHLENRRECLLQSMLLKICAPQFIAVCQLVANNVSRKLPFVMPKVIYNGVCPDFWIVGDKKKARARLGLPTTSPIIGVSGRLEKVKGHDVLIRCLETLPEDIHIALAGEGSQKEALLKQIQSYHAQDRVHLLGLLEPSQIKLFYQAIDIFCLPSLKEGLPLAILEAQSCNKPVVASDVGGVAESLCQLTSTLVPAGSPSLLSDALKVTLENIQKNTVGNPREFILNERNIHTMFEAYRALIGSVKTGSITQTGAEV